VNCSLNSVKLDKKTHSIKSDIYMHFGLSRLTYKFREAMERVRVVQKR